MHLDDLRPWALPAHALPQQEIGRAVALQRHAAPGEDSAGAVLARVARALAEVEPPHNRARAQALFSHAMQAGFIPAGRILAGAGRRSGATLLNCFVQPVGDAILHTQDGRPGIFPALAEAMETMRRGGGVGYDFSPVRPRGSPVRGTGGLAAGPVAFLRVFDQAAQVLEVSGARCGAQMAVLRCDHPDIEAFLRAKEDTALPRFNLSVGVTDAFMHAVRDDATWLLAHASEPPPGGIPPGAARLPDGRWVHGQVSARGLWDRLAQAAWRRGDPGVLFLDTVARENNLAGMEELAAVNPCGEQPLPDYGSCCLGSVDLTRFVRRPFEPDASLDASALARTCEVAVRMLDNVIDATAWPLAAQQVQAQATRRIGLGFTGLADALAMLNLRYDSPAAGHMAAHVAETMRDAAYGASADLALERGAFPRFDAHRFLDAPGYAARLPGTLRERIRVHGLRHSHLLCVAPAGSISLAFADNVSNGIEPAYAWVTRRRVRGPQGESRLYRAEDHAWRLHRQLRGVQTSLPASFVTATELPPQAHVALAAAVAPFVDGAISKTVNLPAAASWEAVREVFAQAWSAGLKGLTVFRATPGEAAVLEPAEDASPAAAQPANSPLC